MGCRPLARDGRSIIEGWGVLTTEVMPRVAPILLLIRDAAVADPEVLDLLGEMDADRLRRMTDNARRLHAGGHLRRGVTVTQAADVLWTYSAPELYELTVLRRGWSLRRYGDFIVEAMVGALCISLGVASAGCGRSALRSRLAPLMNILAVSGSLQSTSSNTRFLCTAQTEAPAGVDVTVYGGLAELPHFNPDLDTDPPLSAVAELRARLAAADGVLIASPEYAHEMPGSLKNALDWVVGSGELYGKPVVIVCVSPRLDGGVNVREALARTLGAQGADVVASMTVQVVKTKPDEINASRERAALDAVFAAFD